MRWDGPCGCGVWLIKRGWVEVEASGALTWISLPWASSKLWESGLSGMLIIRHTPPSSRGRPAADVPNLCGRPPPQLRQPVAVKPLLLHQGRPMSDEMRGRNVVRVSNEYLLHIEKISNWSLCQKPDSLVDFQRHNFTLCIVPQCKRARLPLSLHPPSLHFLPPVVDPCPPAPSPSPAVEWWIPSLYRGEEPSRMQF